MPPLAAAIVGLGINGSAYLAEIFRAGIQAVDHGQTRGGALARPDRPTGRLRYVVLPQAVRIMVPPFCNYGVQLLKDTSLVSSIAAPEIMFRARNLVMETYVSMHDLSAGRRASISRSASRFRIWRRTCRRRTVSGAMNQFWGPLIEGLPDWLPQLLWRGAADAAADRASFLVRRSGRHRRGAAARCRRSGRCAGWRSP